MEGVRRRGKVSSDERSRRKPRAIHKEGMEGGRKKGDLRKDFWFSAETVQS